MFVFFERNGAVEDQMFGRGIGVDVVIARAGELQIVERLKGLHIFLHIGVVVDANAVRIEEGAHGIDTAHAVFVFVLLNRVARILASPQTSVVAHLGGQAMIAAYPVDRAFDLAVGAFDVGS